MKIVQLARRNSNSLLQIGIYTLTNFLTKAMSFAALPMFVNFLSESDMGILSIFSNSLLFLSPIASVGILYTISTDFFKYTKDEFGKRLSTIIYLPIFFSLLSSLFIFIFFDSLQRNYQFDRSFIWLVPACTFLNICFEVFLILSRNENNAKLFAFGCILKTIVELGLAVLLVLFVVKSWQARVAGIFISGLVVFVLFVYIIVRRRYFKWTFNPSYVKEELRFSLPAILFQTAIFCLITSDKFFVMKFFRASQTGIYSVASVFASVLFIFCLAFLQFFQPRFFTMFAKGEGWNAVKHLYMRYTYSMIGFAALLLAVTPMVYHFFLKPSYLSGLSYFYILTLSTLVWSISNLYLSYILFHKNRTSMVSFALFSIACSLTLYYVGIKYMGLIGISISSLVVNLAVLGFILFENKRKGFFAS